MDDNHATVVIKQFPKTTILFYSAPFLATILSIEHYESSDPDLVGAVQTLTQEEGSGQIFLSDFCVAYSAVEHQMK